MASVSPPDPIRSVEEVMAETEALDLSFFECAAPALARKLLVTVLVHKGTAGIIVETEAYGGMDDLAAHSSRGLTDRTRVIFGPPGRAYVYFIYGMHECLNVVAGRDGEPGCVLIRALEPFAGLHLMRERRSWPGRLVDLTNGPGKLTEALAITREQYGAHLESGPLSIRRRTNHARCKIAVGPRVGITKCVDWPLRFACRDNPFVSRPALPPTS